MSCGHVPIHLKLLCIAARPICFQHLAVEGESVLDVGVPVGPVVVAFEFVVFVGEVEGGEVGVEFAVLFEEEVV